VEDAGQEKASSGGLEDDEQAEAAEAAEGEEDDLDVGEAGQGRAPRRDKA